MTLLTNDDALPLDDPGQILVTGPNADDPVAQLGGWTLGWQGVSGNTTPPVRTIRSAILERAPDGTTVEHVATGSEAVSNRATVSSAAAEADVVAVLVKMRTRKVRVTSSVWNCRLARLSR